MFSFLNSTFLFAAAAALIPLIIHLFSKRRVTIIEFSSLKHLKSMQRRQVRRLKIRQLLLLLLRMLIILAVVFAFARPTLQEGSLGSHAEVSAVILLDNSASMNRYVDDGLLFDLAKNRTLEILESFGEADRVCLITLDRSVDSATSAQFVSSAVATEIANLTKAGSGQADLDAALESALNLLANAPSLNREMYIISDRQRTSLPQASELDSIEAKVFVVDLPIETDDNLGVVSLDFGGQLILPGHEFEITARVKNYGEAEASNLLVSLFIDNNRVAQTDLDIAARGESEIRFRRSVSTAGFHSGYVELADDPFSSDNRYYFSFSIPRQSNILIIKETPQPSLLALALTPSPEINQYWSVKESTIENLQGVNFNDYEVVILADRAILPETYLRRLRSYIGSGKSLVIFYNGREDPNAFNTIWSDITGVTIEQPIRTDFSRSGFYTVQSMDIDHPIFSVFDFESGELPQIKFYTLPTVSIDNKARTLMAFSGNRPALVESRYGNGRVMTLTGPISPRYSDITGHAFFVPFLSRMVEYLGSDLSSYDVRLNVGDDVSRAVSLQGAIRSTLLMLAPDSAAYYLTPTEENQSLVLKAKPISLPGIYHTSFAGREIDRFAVNIAAAEGDLAAATPDELATSIGVDDFWTIAEDEDAVNFLSVQRSGRELWRLFLWLAAILIALEIIISRGYKPDEAGA